MSIKLIYNGNNIALFYAYVYLYFYTSVGEMLNKSTITRLAMYGHTPTHI